MYLRTVDLVLESNLIEGIERAPHPTEIAEHERFMKLDLVLIEDLIQFVGVYQSNATLRDRPGLDVRVGSYVAPRGGPEIRVLLQQLLDDANAEVADPWSIHVRYELLHPFTDGNGRSGRMLWYWMMADMSPRRTFLHQFYYQTLRKNEC